MSEKYPGGFVTYNPPTPSQTSATGIWTLSQQEQYQQAGLWPYPGYNIQRSLRFNSADSAYLNRTPASAGNRRTYTWSGWVKRSSIGTGDRRLFEAGASSSNVFWFGFGNDGSTDQFLIQDYSGGFGIQLATTALYRDPSAWYHVVVAIDTTQATSSDRVKLYLNGVQVTSFSTATYPSQNYDTRTNQTVVHDLGGSTVIGGSAYYNGYITEVNFIDGTQLTPSSFGETNAQTGVWQPKAYSGSYGTNGFYLNFSDNSNTTAATLGKDYSGNGNNWAPNNFSVTAGAGNDSLVDSPTSYGNDTGVGGEVRGNYCTWNAVLQTNDAANTYANGNLEVSSSGSNWANGTISTNTGSYYFELTPSAGASGLYLGINNTKTDVRITAYSGGIEATAGGGSNQGSLASWSNGDIIGVAVNGVSKTVQFYRNGSTYGTLVTYTTALDLFPFARNGSISSSTVIMNSGQRAFAYTAPSGYKALCTQNLPTPTIGATSTTLANLYFTPATYTGTNATQSITTDFQPDLVWIKSRSQVSRNTIFDAVRGVTKVLWSDSQDAEGTANAGTGLTSLNSNGFTLGTEIAGTSGSTNVSGVTYVAWNWKANGSGSTNTAGSITSTVSANTTSGFSVVTYTGNGTANATFGHGLGVQPSFVIIKSRSSGTQEWRVWAKAYNGGNGYGILNLTSAFTVDDGTLWGSYPTYTGPTSSVVTVSSFAGVNGSGATFVAYCFAEVAGYSKFGSYTGNGSTDGPFVFTGMRPAWVLIKQTSLSGNNWFIYDTTRSTSNLTQQPLLANASDAELNSSSYGLDVLSNGFKIRTTDTNTNQNNQTYIFMALASTPLKFSLAR